jgi:hypothetical protein
MKTITATVPAWLPDHCGTISDLMRAKEENAVEMAAFYTPVYDGGGPDGWIHIGSAEITITLDDESSMVENAVASLRAAKKKVQADCEIALMQLDGQIQSLLAIEAPKVAG